MGAWIELKTADAAEIAAYKAMPEAAPKGGIVVVQEVFGVNHHIRTVTDRFAAAGYVALAPALFDRVSKGVELSYDDSGMARGMALAKAITPNQQFLTLEAAIEALSDMPTVGIVGFCLGGTLAFAAASRSEFLSAAVGYYGGGIAGLIGADLHCPVQLHFGTNDAHIPAADIAKIKTAYPEMPVYTYPGAGHGFNCDERGAYDKSSATLAWDRTLAFLDKKM